MATVEATVQDTHQLIEKVAKMYGRRIQGVENDLLAQIQKLVEQFPSSGGRLVSDETTKQLMNKLSAMLSKLLRDEVLREMMRDLLPEFDRVGELVRLLHKQENNINVSRALLNDSKRMMVDLTIDSVIGAGYDQQFELPVKRLLYNHVNFGAGVVETANALKQLVKGDGQRSGVLMRFAGQVARDSLAQYAGQVHEAVADAYDLTATRYVGGVIKSSRCQCRRWVQMGILNDDELADEIRLAFKCGGGMIPGTTPTTFRIYRGGYNCLHAAFPTRREPDLARRSSLSSSCSGFCPPKSK